MNENCFERGNRMNAIKTINFKPFITLFIPSSITAVAESELEDERRDGVELNSFPLTFKRGLRFHESHQLFTCGKQRTSR